MAPRASILDASVLCGLTLAVAMPSGVAAQSAASPAAAPATAAYPTAAVLDALKAACPTQAKAQDAIAGRPITGWTKVDPASTPVGPLVEYGRQGGEKMLAGKGRMLGVHVYRATIAGETLYLVPSGIESEGTTVRGCRMYDPGEQRALDGTAVTRWMGREPDTKVDRAELTRAGWSRGYDQADSFEAFRVPAGSPLLAMTKIDGLAFKTDWVEHSTAHSTAPKGSEEKK